MSKFKSAIPLLITILILTSCKKNDKLFTPLTESQTNINFQNTLFEDGPLNVSNYIYFYNGGGVAVGDINNDGLTDVLFTGNMVRNRLYINKGNFQFEDITEKSGVDKLQGWCTGATMVDINNDGYLDIYICRSADINDDMRRNLLFINNKDQTFTEKAAEYGLDDIGYSTQAGFFDFDKDGDLDCFINNHSLQKYTAGVQDDPAIRNDRNPLFASKLFENINGKFTDISIKAGIKSNVITFGLGMSIADFNHDGWPDIYVSNDFNEQDYFFVNNKNGTFSDKLAECMDQVSLYSMGNDAADYDNDGLTDIITLDMLPEDNKTQKQHSGAENFDKFQLLFKKGYYYQYSRNMLHKNNGDGTFSEVAQLANVSNTDWSWASLFCDFDNDGFKDLFVTNGYVKDYSDMDFLKYSVDRVIRQESNDPEAMKEYISKMPSNKIPNYILQNKNGIFTKKTTEWGLDQPLFSYGTAYVDLDNDGDMDLVVNNSNDKASIYKNNAESILKNNYLKIKLLGPELNKQGLGAKVTVYTDGKLYYQENYPVRGFQSSVDPLLTFGIGNTNKIDSVKVEWPNGNLQLLSKISTNKLTEIKYADSQPKNNIQLASKLIFKEVNSLQFSHIENNFSDFTIQSLMPHYLSRQGPCMAVSDINGDKLDDLFIGGAKGQTSTLFIQNKNGNFTQKAPNLFISDANTEDTAAEFFDADNDGDSDLIVTGGGYETQENDISLQPRLYINDSKGNFEKSTESFPKLLINSGVVKAADIDNDGDVDLFMGGRVNHGKYPSSPQSAILLNNGKGSFTNATSQINKDILKLGMVTDAIWLDLNSDKYPELVVVGEWMPIKVFENIKGKLLDKSSQYIPFATSGWWNKITAADTDGDGDKDLIVGNLGLNAQIKASEKEPATVIYKDFEGRGSYNPIVSYYIEGVSYPAASRDDLVDQMPSLKKKFLEYHTYSSATINDLFTAEQLQDAGQLSANEFSTLYLQNNGGKPFTKKELPIEAQYGPVYGISAQDFNNDGKLDLILAGNNAWSRIKYGRYTANHGSLFINDGKGNFNFVPQYKSGLKVRGNVRSLVAINKNLIFGVNDDALKIYKY